MKTLTFSLRNPNTLKHHRAGIGGLASALFAFNNVPFTWEVTKDTVTINYECSDRQFLETLLQHTYSLDSNGFLTAFSYDSSAESKYIFHRAVSSTFLQNGSHRNAEYREYQKKVLGLKDDEAKVKPIPVVLITEEKEIPLEYTPVFDCPYTSMKQAEGNVFKVNKKVISDDFRDFIPVSEMHFPGLSGKGAYQNSYQETVENYISLLFLPIACKYYFLQSGGNHVIIVPTITNLLTWAKRQSATRLKLKSWYVSAPEESLFRFSLENTMDNHGVQEAYVLGAQNWVTAAQRRKINVIRKTISPEKLDVYATAYYEFGGNFVPNKPKKNEQIQGYHYRTSDMLGLVCRNLLNNQAWYANIATLFWQHRQNSTSKNYFNFLPKEIFKMINQHFSAEEKAIFDLFQTCCNKYVKVKNDGKSDKEFFDFRDRLKDKLLIESRRYGRTQKDFTGFVLKFIASNHRAEGLCQDSIELLNCWLADKALWRQSQHLFTLAIAAYGKKLKAELVTITSTDVENKEESLEIV